MLHLPQACRGSESGVVLLGTGGWHAEDRMLCATCCQKDPQQAGQLCSPSVRRRSRRRGAPHHGKGPPRGRVLQRRWARRPPGWGLPPRDLSRETNRCNLASHMLRCCWAATPASFCGNATLLELLEHAIHVAAQRSTAGHSVARQSTSRSSWYGITAPVLVRFEGAEAGAGGSISANDSTAGGWAGGAAVGLAGPELG